MEGGTMTDMMKEIARTVIFLFSADKNPQPIGTGFIVGYIIPGKENRYVPLIVTAKHVTGDRQKILGRFSTQEGASTTYVQYDIASLKKSNDYWEHPDDDGVDIVVFRSLHYDVTNYKILPFDLIASKTTFDEEKIRQTDRIMFPSLLINFMGTSMNYPVFRDGTIALIPEEKVPLRYMVGSKEINTQQEIILVDATSIQGASGSPVFLRPGPRLKGNTFNLGESKAYLIGVMHGFYPATPRKILEIETSKTQDMYAENSGIAIIFPSWKLQDILQNQSFIGRMNQIIEPEDNKN